MLERKTRKTSDLLKNADKATDLKEVVTVADEVGAKDKDNLGSVLKTPIKQRI